MKNIILNHNRKLLSEENTNVNPATLCNCRNAEDCPLGGNCLEKELVHKASVTTNQNENFYIGLTEREFKTRYNNHIPHHSGIKISQIAQVCPNISVSGK